MGSPLVTLPGGRRAEVRAPTGADEAFLLEEGAGLAPAARTTELLARCVVRLDGEAAGRESVRALPVGDREALLLHVRRLVAGDRLDAVVTCPAVGCREPLELELRVEELLLAPAEGRPERHELPLGPGREPLRFRLLTGGDQEALAELARVDAEAAAEAALARCAEGPLDPGLTAALDAELARLDPQAELLLELTCPACGTAFTSELDAGEFLRRELVPRPDDLYREVQLLAATCHWSEAEILALSARRRRAYCAALGAPAGEPE